MLYNQGAKGGGGGGVVDVEGYLPRHVQNKTLKMISSNYNIKQYMFGETMSTNN